METARATENVTGHDINIKLNGLTISYNDLGKGTVPIIFIHGFPFNKSSWEPQMEFFKKTNRVIAYDVRGFGNSSSGREKESIRLFADDLIKFMDGLEIPKAIVCGFSMGGYILLNAICHYPKRFDAIILSDTQCISDSVEAKEKRSQTIAQIAAGKIKDFTEGFIKNIFCQESLDTKQELVEKTRETILSTSPVSIMGALSAIADRQPMCALLNEINVPVLILCGKEDALTPPDQSEFLQSHIVNSKLCLIDSAGHLSNLEQPEKFNQCLNDFLLNLEQ